MPRDLFGDVIDPSITPGTRKWYSVPLSLLVHVLAIGAVIVAPLLATGALPMPDTGVSLIRIEPPRLPDPPPVRAATPPARPATSPDAAPVVAPAEIAPEPQFDTTFEQTTTSDIGVPGAAEIEAGGIVAPPPPSIVAPPPREPVRIGAHVRPPERVTYVAPVYPPLARAARVQGLVVIEAIIDEQGRVTAARVLGSDSPLLNDAALAALGQWQYTPTLLNGVPTAVIMTVTVHFKLQ